MGRAPLASFHRPRVHCHLDSRPSHKAQMTRRRPWASLDGRAPSLVSVHGLTSSASACGRSLVVKSLSSKEESRVRFPSPALSNRESKGAPPSCMGEPRRIGAATSARRGGWRPERTAAQFDIEAARDGMRGAKAPIPVARSFVVMYTMRWRRRRRGATGVGFCAPQPGEGGSTHGPGARYGPWIRVGTASPDPGCCYPIPSKVLQTPDNA